MGADIHLYVEAKPVESEHDWQRFTRSLSHENWRETRSFNMGWGTYRNYSAFAMLADVRNGSGFAGVDLGDGFEPIDKPRGLPNDISDPVQRESDGWSGDGHSHSWFTLRELLDLEHAGYWDKTTTHRGVLHRAEFEKVEDDGLVIAREGQNITLSSSPSSWAGAISGPPPEDLFNASWVETYRDSQGWIIPMVEAITEAFNNFGLHVFFTEGMDPDKRKFPVIVDNPQGEMMDHWVDKAPSIRIAFWFDN